MTDVITLLGRPIGYRVYDSFYYRRKCLHYPLALSGVFVTVEYNMAICPDKHGKFLEDVFLVGGWCFNYFDHGKVLYNNTAGQ